LSAPPFLKARKREFAGLLLQYRGVQHLLTVPPIGGCKHELNEIYSAISEMAKPLNPEIASEKAELNELFKATDAVRAAQRSLAACADKVLTAAAVPGLVKAQRHGPEAITVRVGGHDASHSCSIQPLRRAEFKRANIRN